MRTNGRKACRGIPIVLHPLEDEERSTYIMIAETTIQVVSSVKCRLQISTEWYTLSTTSDEAVLMSRHWCRSKTRHRPTTTLSKPYQCCADHSKPMTVCARVRHAVPEERSVEGDRAVGRNPNSQHGDWDNIGGSVKRIAGNIDRLENKNEEGTGSSAEADLHTERGKRSASMAAHPSATHSINGEGKRL